MSSFKKQSRTPLLNVLRNAFQIAKQAQNKNSPPPDELYDLYRQNVVHRRRFIGDVMKTGVALSAASLLNACQKAIDLTPTIDTPLQNAGRKANAPRIAILGAGMAGLNCAYQLKKSGYIATVYEAATRTGGRMFSKTNLLANGLTTELGGEFIDSGHKDMLKLCREFNLPLIDTLTKEESAYARDSFYIDGRFYTEEEVNTAFQPYAARIDADIRSLPKIMTYDNHDAVTLHFDNMSIADYFDSIGMTGFIREGFETAYLTEYGLETAEQSAINFLYLFDTNTANGIDIFGTSDERYKIQGGNQQLTDALHAQVKNQVMTQHQVVKIKEKAMGYSLYFQNANGSTVQADADIVVCTIPFSILKDVELEVALPQWKANAIQNLGYGTNSKLLLGFNSRVWRNYQHSAYVFTDSHIQTGWDNSFGQPVQSGGFTVYGGGIKGVALGEGTPEGQAPKFVAQLEQMWPGCGSAYTGVAKRMHWPTYPLTKGSYACYKVGQYTTIRGAEIKTIGNLYFAGEHCSSWYQGFMNGAAETGRMAAEEILKAVKAEPVMVMN